MSGADCYCDENGSCSTAAGEECSSTDPVTLVDAVDINGTDYVTQEVECYCLSSDCELDVDGDMMLDCLIPDGDLCVPEDADDDGYADGCLTEEVLITDVISADLRFQLGSARSRNR